MRGRIVLTGAAVVLLVLAALAVTAWDPGPRGPVTRARLLSGTDLVRQLHLPTAEPAPRHRGRRHHPGDRRRGRPPAGRNAAGPPSRPPPWRPGPGVVDGRFLVAYYGTAGTGVLGVLGEDEPDVVVRRLRRAAAAFRRPGERVQPVFELIVTVADRGPGEDGDYSHDIDPSLVRRYVDAARRHRLLLVLDLQPGRSDFLTVARRWEWALRDPAVGLALDPEWRVTGRRVPGRVLGSVGPGEINRTTAWLARLTRRHQLPEKLVLLHQFRTSMIRGIHRVRDRPGLALVQHVDGFGTRRQKLATYHAVARPRQFRMGLKLFYDEDVRLLDAATVRRIRPRVRFVSFQ